MNIDKVIRLLKTKDVLDLEIALDMLERVKPYTEGARVTTVTLYLDCGVLGEQECEVNFVYYKHLAATFWEQAEPAHYEFLSIVATIGGVDVDISVHLKDFSEIEKQLEKIRIYGDL